MFAQILISTLLAAGLLSNAADALAQTRDTPVPAAVAGDDEIYEARPGDTMIGIARRLLHDGDNPRVQRALQQHNRLSDADRIYPGQQLRVPRAWLKSRPAELVVVAAQGDVRAGGAPLRAGASVGEGARVATGEDGYVTLRLADGSTLRLQPAASARIERARAQGPAGTTDTVIGLDAGGAQARVQAARAGQTRFDVRTPIAVAAVRGTEFRVRADAANGTMTSEVLEGTVGVADAEARGKVDVTAGFGTRVRRGEAPLPPRPLLPAPTLWDGVRVVDRHPIRLNFEPLRGAATYRMQLSLREDFGEMLAEESLDRPDLRLGTLADGDYFLRVRGIDDIGLEGRDATVRLKVAVNPASPRSDAPAVGERLADRSR